MTILVKASRNLTDQPTAQGYIGKGVLGQPHNLRTILRNLAAQQHTTAAAASAALICVGLPRHSGRNECPLFEAKPEISTKSVSSGS
jgi:hypothetical protein